MRIQHVLRDGIAHTLVSVVERNAPEVLPNKPPPPVVMGAEDSLGAGVEVDASSAGGGAALSLLPLKMPPIVFLVLLQPFSTVEQADRGPAAKAKPSMMVGSFR